MATVWKRERAGWAFGAILVAAVPLILYQGREQWFFFDDWYFLDPISSLSISGVMEPYWGHWTLVPRLLDSVLFSLFGLHHYLPYQLFVVAAHVACAALLWIVMTRAKVQPWIATAAATFFLLFGPGRQNMVWAFQVSMTGSLMFGLAQLVLADHDGPINRRDLAAVGCGLLAIASTNLGVILVMATVIATLIRRGWRAAVVQGAPPATAYLTWFVVVARHTKTPLDFVADSPRQLAEYAWGLVRRLYLVVGPGPTGFVLVAGVVVLGVGLVRNDHPEWAAPLALLVGAPLFVLSTSFARAGSLAVPIPPDPTPGRYMHVLVALSLPTVAVALTQMARRCQWVPLVVVVGVLACLPANVRAIATPSSAAELGDPINALVTADVVRQFPTLPTHKGASLALLKSVGWVAEQDRAGRIPAAPPGHETLRSAVFSYLAFESAGGDASRSCPAVAAPDQIRLLPDDVLQVRAPAGSELTLTDQDRHLVAQFPIGSTGSLAVRVTAGPMNVVPDLSPPPPVVRFALCR
ncbi:MAG: hypothetical protein ABIP03_01175 [Aquihabitans sp.]